MKSILFIILIAVNVIAGNLEEAQNAIDSNDYKRAFELLQPLSREGNNEAQFLLANIYFYDKGTKEDIKTAFILYEKAAKQNNAKAQLTLAIHYCYADKIKKDLKMCAYWADQAKLNGKDVSRLWNHFELDKYFDKSIKVK